VELGGDEVEVWVAAVIQGALQEGLDLGIEALADAVHLRAGDAGVRADRRNQGIDLPGGEALDPGLHAHRVESLIHPPIGLDDCREEAGGVELLLWRSLAPTGWRGECRSPTWVVSRRDRLPLR